MENSYHGIKQTSKIAHNPHQRELYQNSLNSGLVNIYLKEENKFLKRVLRNQNLIINGVDGEATIAEAKKIFQSGMELSFKDERMIKVGSATKDTTVGMYEIIIDSTFIQIFQSLLINLELLHLTQNQIINFCTKYVNWFENDGHLTFFLLKIKQQFLVVFVIMKPKGLYIGVRRYGHVRIWDGNCRNRMVIPHVE